MEKFGIFELLDTLSALTAAPAADKTVPDADGTAPEIPADARRPDAAPSFRTDAPAASDAFAAFVARHDAISRKAKK